MMTRSKVSRLNFTKRLIPLGLLWTLALPVTPLPLNPLSAGPALAETKSLGEKVYENVSQAIVSIEAGDSQGSGVIIQSDGLGVTNEHVVAGQRTITVILGDGTRLMADVVATGEKCQDIALFQIRGRPNLRTVKLGSSHSVRPGQEVFTLGNSRGYSRSFKPGIISRFQPGDRHIQTTLPLDPGDSGSPLLQADGIMVGLNTSIDPQTRTLSFSIQFQQTPSRNWYRGIKQEN